MRKAILPLLVGLSLSAMATSAHAASFLFSNVGDSYTIDFNGYTGNPDTPISGLTGQIIYSLSSISADGKTYSFGVTVANTSGGDTETSRLSGFGFNVDPDIKKNGAIALSSSDFSVVGSGQVPSGFGKVEVCFFGGGGKNCSGGGNGGAQLGQTLTGDFSLSFASAPVDGITFDNLFVRYQSITNNAAGIKGGSGVGQPTTPVSAVPEPATWGMMIVGFGLIGASMRRSRRETKLSTVQ